MDLIYTHTSGGTLWQGGNLDVRKYSKMFDVVALMAEEYQPDLVGPVIFAGIDDSEDMLPEEVTVTKKIANAVSDIMADTVSRGKNALSTCWMGWNRSGLVSGLTLVKLGYTPKDAIDVIQLARKDALNNNLFKKIIMGQV